jgi:HemX protein
MTSITVLHGASLLSYLGAGGLAMSSLAAGHRNVPRAGVALIATALLVHAAGLIVYTVRFAELPLVGLGASLSTLAFLIGAALLGAAALRSVRPLALVLIPLIAILLAGALTLGLAPGRTVSQFRGVWFAAHVVLAFLGYASLAVAFAAGLLYLVQWRALKGKNFGRAFRFFPPLETLDRLRQSALFLGFFALTFALTLAWAWTIRFLNTLATENLQVIWGVVTWLVFSAALLSRAGGGGAERRAAATVVAGFFVVVLSYVLLRVVADARGFL